MLLKVSQARTGKTEMEGKKKRQDVGTGREARNHMQEDRCNPCVVPLHALWGLSVTVAETLKEYFAMSRSCHCPRHTEDTEQFLPFLVT